MLKTVTGGECSLIRLDGHPRPAFLSKEEVKSGETCGNKLKKPEVAIFQTKGTVVRDGVGVWVGIGGCQEARGNFRFPVSGLGLTTKWQKSIRFWGQGPWDLSSR